MHIKRRGRQAMLYRSRWIPKGTNGNSHGYSVQEYVGSLPTEAQTIPTNLRARLSDDECLYVDRVVIQTACAAAQEQERQAARRERDPQWRLAEAERLVGEAVERSAAMPVAAHAVSKLLAAVANIRTSGQAVGSPTVSQADPLRAALQALRSAAGAVREGRYGKAPETGVRSTKTYSTWSDICALVLQVGEASLLSALQEQGWVKKRGR